MDTPDLIAGVIAWTVIVLGTATLLVGIRRGWRSWTLHKTIAGAPSLVVAAVVQYGLAAFLLARRPLAPFLAPLLREETAPLTIACFVGATLALGSMVVAVATHRRGARS